MFDETPLVMVENQEAMTRCVELLSRATVVGVDTESDSFYSYEEKVCLLQISDFDQDYVIDPLKVKDLSGLSDIFADPKVVKILHGADYDIVCLKRDYGFEFRHVFDTLVGAQLLGLPKIGLGDLIKAYFGVHLEKAYQRHNWSLRPLQPEHIDYARGDTHWLPALRELMLRQLRSCGRVEHLEEECALLEKKTWQGRVFDEDGYLNVRGANVLGDGQLRVLRRLFLYRDQEGRRMNRPVFKVIPDDMLVRVAKRCPESVKDLEGLMSSKSSIRRRHGAKFIELVAAGKEDDFPIPAPKKKKKQNTESIGPVRLRGKAADRAFELLKDWRNGLVKRDPNQSSFTVASNKLLKQIASVCPRDLDELQAVRDVRKWQVRDHGEAILKVLEKMST